MSSSARMPIYKVTVLGDGGVGKTALTIQLCLNHFVETYDPTIEDSYRKQIMVNGTQSLLEVLDTAGQEEYTALRDQWIRDGDGFLLVYSITSRSTFDRVRKFVDQISRVKDLAPFEIPIMVVGNKCDKTMEREVNISEGMQLAQALKCGFLEASAKTGSNVEESFLGVVENIRLKREGDLRLRSPSDQQQVPGQSSLQPVQSDRSELSKHSGKNKKRQKDKCLIM